MAEKKVFIIAKSQSGGPRELGKLDTEQEDIKVILEESMNLNVRLLLCASFSDIKKEFHKNEEVIGLHYIGHANSMSLELTDGNLGFEEFAEFLGNQAKEKKLQMVFLNACSTATHAKALHGAKIPIVIGTHQSVNDEVAYEVAIKFYTALATKKNYESAFNTAISDSQEKIRSGKMRELFYEGRTQDLPEHGQLWQIMFSEEKFRQKKPLFAHIPLKGDEYLCDRKRERGNMKYFWNNNTVSAYCIHGLESQAPDALSKGFLRNLQIDYPDKFIGNPLDKEFELPQVDSQEGVYKELILRLYRKYDLQGYNHTSSVHNWLEAMKSQKNPEWLAIRIKASEEEWKSASKQAVAQLVSDLKGASPTFVIHVFLEVTYKENNFWLRLKAKWLTIPNFHTVEWLLPVFREDMKQWLEFIAPDNEDFRKAKIGGYDDCNEEMKKLIPELKKVINDII